MNVILLVLLLLQLLLLLLLYAVYVCEWKAAGKDKHVVMKYPVNKRDSKS